ncbi:MAG: hypothetical protein ACLVEJ_31325 [Parabacteroides sp.]
MKENPGVKSVQVYDGNSSNSTIKADGQLLSNGAGYTRIAPMQSFFHNHRVSVCQPIGQVYGSYVGLCSRHGK